MKNMSVIFLSLFAFTFSLLGHALADPTMTSTTANQIQVGNLSTPKKVIEVEVTHTNNSTDDSVNKTGNPAAKTTALAERITAATETIIEASEGALTKVIPELSDLLPDLSDLLPYLLPDLTTDCW